RDLVDKPVSTVDLDCQICRTYCRLAGVVLGFRRCRAERLAAHHHITCPPYQHACRISFYGYVGDHFLNQLKFSNRLAELFTLLYVGDALVKACLNDANTAGGYRYSPLVQCAHRDLEAVAFGAEHSFGRNTHIGKRQLGGCLPSQTELAVNCSCAEARSICVYHERAYATGTGFSRPRENDRDVGPCAVGNKCLRAVDHVVAAVAYC